MPNKTDYLLKRGQPEYGLQVSYTDSDTITLSPGRIHASDETTIMEVGAALTATISGMGGSEPSNGLAYPWLGVNASGVASFWLDTSPTTTSALEPAGIVAKRYIGLAIHNVTGTPDQIWAFTSVREGRQVRLTYSGLASVVSTSSSGISETAFSIASFVPSTASTAVLMGEYRANNNTYHNCRIYLSSGGALTMEMNVEGAHYQRNKVTREVPVSLAGTAGTLYYQADRSDPLDIQVAGFVESI